MAAPSLIWSYKLLISGIGTVNSGNTDFSHFTNTCAVSYHHMRLALFSILPLFFLSCQSDESLNIQFPKGGYPYVTTTSSKDSSFYALPLKDVFSKPDSMLYAYQGRQFFRSFKEPNLSLSPPQKPVFRYISVDAFGVHPVLITLNEEEIIVKEGIKGDANPYPDETRLSPTEYEHFMLMNLYIPTYLRSNKPERINFVDSVVALYPQLRDAHYYARLMDKGHDPKKATFVYTTRRVSISKKTYYHLVKLINESGFWQLPYRPQCPNLPNDAGGMNLEAVTPDQYHMVFTTFCPDDSTLAKFGRACDELEKTAKLDEKEWRKKYRAMNPVKPRATSSDTVHVVEVELDTSKRQE